MIVGGGGERRTLRLAAQYADAANVTGDLATVRGKAQVLRTHCARSGRTVALTHLSTALVAADRRRLHEVVAALRPRGTTEDSYRSAVNAGTVDDHIGRLRELAEAGVSEVMVRLVGPQSLDAMAEVISAFR